jgi:hypothetical protein
MGSWRSGARPAASAGRQREQACRGRAAVPCGRGAVAPHRSTPLRAGRRRGAGRWRFRATGERGHGGGGNGRRTARQDRMGIRYCAIGYAPRPVGGGMRTRWGNLSPLASRVRAATSAPRYRGHRPQRRHPPLTVGHANRLQCSGGESAIDGGPISPKYLGGSWWGQHWGQPDSLFALTPGNVKDAPPPLVTRQVVNRLGVFAFWPWRSGLSYPPFLPDSSHAPASAASASSSASRRAASSALPPSKAKSAR